MNCKHIFLLPVITITVLLTTLISCDADASDYYVDSSAGNDSNSGTSSATPWKTLAKVKTYMRFFQAGDHVKLKRGSIFYENLKITAPGTTFESYGTGNLPIVDGSGLLNSDGWVVVEENIYSYSISSYTPKILFYNGAARPPLTTLLFDSVPETLQKNAVLLQLDNYYSSFWVRSVTDNRVSGITRFSISPDVNVYVRQVENGKERQWSETLGKPAVIQGTVALTEPGDWYWNESEKRIYFYAESYPGNSVRAGRLDDGLRVEVDSVTVQDLVVQKFNKQGIVLYKGRKSTVQRVNVNSCGMSGIQMWNTSDNVVANNVIDSNRGGISLYALPGSSLHTTGNQIRNNTVSNSRGSGIGLSRDQMANPGDVSDNTISANNISNSNAMSYDGAGIYTFYAGSNTIRDNRINNNGSIYLRSAGVMVDVSADPMTITGNIIKNNSTGGVVVSGDGHIISNNTLVDNGVSSMDRAQINFFEAGRNASNCTVTGNVMEATGGYNFFKIDAGNTSGHTIDYNSYKGLPTSQFYWSSRWFLFEDWQKTTGFDSHSTFDKSVTVTGANLLLLK